MAHPWTEVPWTWAKRVTLVLANHASSSHATRTVEYACPLSYSSHTFSFVLLLLQHTQFDVHVPTAESPVNRLPLGLHAAVLVRW
jgi:hypothetical protein